MSAESSIEFPDRLSLMEVRLQAQEDEITLLKSSLADALRKLRIHDQQIPMLKQQLITGKSLINDFSLQVLRFIIFIVTVRVFQTICNQLYSLVLPSYIDWCNPTLVL